MPKVLFLNLTTFSTNGGIEKFNRCFLKALDDLAACHLNLSSQAISLYDDKADERYYNQAQYKGFKSQKIAAVLNSILIARTFDTIVIGHINLSIAGWVIKKIFPRKKIILITHGIEVWQPLSGFKAKLLKLADTIITVSKFTKNKICSVQNIAGENIVIFPNTIDPLFAIPNSFNNDNSLLKSRYGINGEDIVLFTLARVTSTERYKGYDVVMECLPEILLKFPNLKYVIGGKYDNKEKERLDGIIRTLKLEGVVKLTGFIEDKDLMAHYQMSDMFIMPSRKEGFGIVFIEAMVCGLPVIAGNMDGSVDALKDGELGTLVNPLDKAEITQQICGFFENRHVINEEYRLSLQQKVLQYFGFDAFKSRLRAILEK